MMNRFARAVAATVLVVPLAYAGTIDFRLNVPPKPQLLTVRTLEIDEIVYVPIKDLATAVGAGLEWDPFTHKLSLKGPTWRLNVMVGGNVVLIEGRILRLRHRVRFDRGVILAPLDFVTHGLSQVVPLEVVPERVPLPRASPSPRPSRVRPTARETLARPTAPPTRPEATVRSTETLRPIFPSGAEGPVLRKTVQTIVLDPGHGGADPGCIGSLDSREADITLQLALRIKEEIERQSNWRVVLTRETDETLRADERAAIANQQKGDVFVSIHCNYAFSSDVGGLTTTVVTSAADPESWGQRTANDTPLWNHNYRIFERSSKQLGKFLREEVGRTTNLTKRPVRPALLAALVGLQMPAAQIDVGFLSNPAEEQMLRSKQFQELVAKGVLRALQHFAAWLEPVF